jgi:hypothetical protein
LGQIQLKLTYVAILCAAKPRNTGNLTQRPAKPNCSSPLPTSSFWLSAQAAHMTQQSPKAIWQRPHCLLNLICIFDTKRFKTQDVTAFSGALGVIYQI